MVTERLKKIAAGAAAAVLALTAGTCTTLAFMTAGRDTTLTNTFTSEPGLIADGSFVLNETDVVQQPDYTYSFVPDTEPKVTAVDYELVPGKDVPKDPAVRISGLSSAESVLFLEVVNGLAENPYLSFEIDGVWQKTAGIIGEHGGDVYIYSPEGTPAVLNSGYGQSHPEISAINILKDRTVKVAGTDGDGTRIYDLLLGEDGPELSFYAYLCQVNAAGNSSQPEDIIQACGYASASS